MAEARGQLQKLTECSICLKTFTDPRMLPCIHTFCLECLKETGKGAKKKDGENLPCPLCRSLFVIPAEGMYHLQKNLFMQHLIDVTTVIQVGQKSVADCDICKAYYEGDEEKTKEATMLCLECGDNFCDICAKMHKLHKSSKTHNIIKIGCEMEEDIRKMQPTRTCAFHNQQPLSFYCADCKKIICVSCFVENHASHKCRDVTSVEKEFRQTIEINASKISNFAKETLSKGNKMEQRTTEIISSLAEAEARIRKRNAELKEMVDSHTDSLLLQLSEIKQKHVKDISADKEEIERIYTILKRFEIYCTELRLKWSPPDVYDCVDELVKRANELEKDYKAFIDRPYKKTEVSFKPTDLGELLSTSQDNIVGQITVPDETLQQGLRNNGDNNYFKAVVGCFWPLLEVLRSRTISKQPLTETLVNFLNTRHLDLAEQNECFSNFVEQLYKSSPKFNNFRQHESHDLFIEFLNVLRSEERHRVARSPQFNGDPKTVLTAVDEVFGGHFITIYTCQSCNEPNFPCEYLLDISLPIPVHTRQHPQNFSGISTGGHINRFPEQPRVLHVHERRYTDQDVDHSYYGGIRNYFTQVSLQALNEEQVIPTGEGGRFCSRPVTLTECLRLYTLTEHVPEGHVCLSCLIGQETVTAANAQTTQSAMKRTLIYNPPAFLVLHIDRFKRTASGFTKLSDRVTYEEYLDLGPYCSSDCLGNDQKDYNVWYSLYGVVIHSGSVESGHYSAYVKIRNASAAATKTYLQKTYLDCVEVSSQQLRNLFSQRSSRPTLEIITPLLKKGWRPKPETDGRWNFVDSDSTRPTTLHESLNQEAYMLFYERVSKCR